MFGNVYQGKKILITGHTGFKGTWLTFWLLQLGAKVVGVSNKIPTKPSMFEVLGLKKKIKHYTIDIRNLNDLTKIISLEKPDYIFHLAAQAIVSNSFKDPINTISSNVMGTANLLESLRILNNRCTVILITSDKVYDNVEQIWGYKENDLIGGKDIYSGSKGATELIIKSYYHSFFKLNSSKLRFAVARAGNVVGGGDWAKDRIVVDAISAWSQDKTVEIRNPNSTRPWQHVLEPLSGYLSLGMKLNKSKSLNGECFNFGPNADQNKNVKELLTDLSTSWNSSKKIKKIKVRKNKSFYEAKLLKLNCEKSYELLNWHSSLEYKDTINFISEWYMNFYDNKEDMNKITYNQIIDYCKIAKSKFLKWTE